MGRIMKIKYLILVSLMLAILTFGAASASYDADTIAVDDDAGDAISQADDIDVAGQDGDDSLGEKSEVDYELENTDGDYVPVNDQNASIGIEINNQDITGNITVKITGDGETEKVISEKIKPSIPGYLERKINIV